MVLDTSDNVNNGNPSPLEALLAGAEGFPPMLDIPPDADDETMVELAIALSLQQDQQGKTRTAIQVFNSIWDCCTILQIKLIKYDKMQKHILKTIYMIHI